MPFRRTGSRTNRFARGRGLPVLEVHHAVPRYEQTWVTFDRPEIFLTGGWIHALETS